MAEMLKIKLTDLRPCDKCRGPLVPIFYVLRSSMAILNREATNEQMGLTTMFGGTGQAAAIAEVMGAHGDNVVELLAQQPKGEWTDLFVCQKCYLGGGLDLAVMAESLRDREESKEEIGGAGTGDIGPDTAQEARDEAMRS